MAAVAAADGVHRVSSELIVSEFTDSTTNIISARCPMAMTRSSFSLRAMSSGLPSSATFEGVIGGLDDSRHLRCCGGRRCRRHGLSKCRRWNWLLVFVGVVVG